MKVQRSAWGLDGSTAVPPHVMIAAQRHGGLVLGAYDGERMVGVLFGFTSLERGRPFHYSHITGVVKKYQSSGVGFRLKLAQRRHVLQSGQSLVKWTYDPLQAGNAFFNIQKLGAICRVYHRNLYGSLNDSLNRERLTDRFEVEWWLKSKRVLDRIQGGGKLWSLGDVARRGAMLANETVRTRFGWRQAVVAHLGLMASRILVEIPESILRVRDSSLKISNDWTLNLRRIFEHYFKKGYAASNVLVKETGDERRVFYLLEQYHHSRKDE